MKKILKFIIAFLSGVLASLFFFTKEKGDKNETQKKYENIPAKNIVDNNADNTSVESDIHTITTNFRERVRDRFKSELHGNTSNSDDSNNI